MMRGARLAPSPFALAGGGKKKMSAETASNPANGYGVFFVERMARARAATSAISAPILG